MGDPASQGCKEKDVDSENEECGVSAHLEAFKDAPRLRGVTMSRAGAAELQPSIVDQAKHATASKLLQWLRASQGELDHIESNASSVLDPLILEHVLSSGACGEVEAT